MNGGRDGQEGLPVFYVSTGVKGLGGGPKNLQWWTPFGGPGSAEMESWEVKHMVTVENLKGLL